MNKEGLEQLIHSVLYEGYILYPYRVSALKNQKRFTFGRVYPEVYSRLLRGADPSSIQTECLVKGASPEIEIEVRFLQPIWREVMVNGSVVGEIKVGQSLLQTWQEAIEREIRLPECKIGNWSGKPQRHCFHFEAGEAIEPGPLPEIQIRRRREPISGVIECAASELSEGGWRISIQVKNTSCLPESSMNDQDAVLMRTFASTHTILSVREGAFISLLEPPQEYASAAALCQNLGVWPVLIGDQSKQEANCMLASPIILYDYPRIAPESAVDHCDGTEIDELLALRITAMTNSEKNEMRQACDWARRILESSESLPPERFLRMHGAIRKGGSREGDLWNSRTKISGVTVNGVFLRAGGRVRIRPKRGTDAMDMMLADKGAVIESVEQDLEGRVYFALILDDDPGKDMGFSSMPGHRFFYTTEEVEPEEI